MRYYMKTFVEGVTLTVDEMKALANTYRLKMVGVENEWSWKVNSKEVVVITGSMREAGTANVLLSKHGVRLDTHWDEHADFFKRVHGEGGFGCLNPTTKITDNPYMDGSLSAKYWAQGYEEARQEVETDR